MNLSKSALQALAQRVACCATTAVLLVPPLWGARLLPTGRPVLMLMVYLLLLAVAAVAAVTAVVGRFTCAVDSAFRAGYLTASAEHFRTPSGHAPQRPERPRLTLVE